MLLIPQQAQLTPSSTTPTSPSLRSLIISLHEFLVYPTIQVQRIAGEISALEKSYKKQKASLERLLREVSAQAEGSLRWKVGHWLGFQSREELLVQSQHVLLDKDYMLRLHELEDLLAHWKAAKRRQVRLSIVVASIGFFIQLIATTVCLVLYTFNAFTGQQQEDINKENEHQSPHALVHEGSSHNVVKPQSASEDNMVQFPLHFSFSLRLFLRIIYLH